MQQTKHKSDEQTMSSSEKIKKSSATIPTVIEKANEFKTRGNDCVKLNQYQKAIHYYTEAIRLNKIEPVYYTNRALCYLKQNKFTECIGDCTKAIDLDKKAVKAYYRRMQAIEQNNGDLNAALSDCKMVLEIEPKNADAKRSLDRIQNLLYAENVKIAQSVKKITKKTEEKLVWSQYENIDGYERIEFVSKEPHLRSKQPMKRINVMEHNDQTSSTNHHNQSNDKAQTTDETFDKGSELHEKTKEAIETHQNELIKSKVRIIFQ